MKEKHGVEYGLQSPEIYEKTRQTVRDRYGVENPSHLESVKTKISDKAKARMNRPIVKILQALINEHHIKIPRGWNNRSDDYIIEQIDRIKAMFIESSLEKFA